MNIQEYHKIHPDDEINYFGSTNFRNQQRKFGIKLDDRRRHMYIVGKTGMGKTTLLENMVMQDIEMGHGLAYIDPHGDTADLILDYIPNHRINDVVHFNPSDLEFPIAFNILESVDIEQKHLVASGLMGVFTKIWANLWSARMEYILNNTVLALLEVPGNTLLGIMRMLVDKSFRKKIVSRVTDPIVRAFWTEEFANYNDRFRTEAIAPIQNKVGQFLSSSIIRNIVGQTKSTIDLRDVMDNQKILIMNLSKGKIGEDASALLGAMMITKLQLAAMSRVDTPESERKDFFLYVDEFQNFATESFASILSEARKYRLNLIMAHQYMAQLSEEVAAAVFGNVGSMVVMRVGADDAEQLEKEFTPEFTALDLVNLPKWQICLKLMIDGVASNPFSANTLPKVYAGGDFAHNRPKVIKVSRERYANPKEGVEDKIVRWLSPEAVAKEAAAGARVDEDEERFDHEKEKKQAANPNAVCDNCEDSIYIPFEPDPKRNVFCKECLQKFKNGDIDASKLSKHNVKPPKEEKKQDTNAGETKADNKQDQDTSKVQDKEKNVKKDKNREAAESIPKTPPAQSGQIEKMESQKSEKTQEPPVNKKEEPHQTKGSSQGGKPQKDTGASPKSTSNARKKQTGPVFKETPIVPTIPTEEVSLSDVLEKAPISFSKRKN